MPVAGTLRKKVERRSRMKKLRSVSGVLCVFVLLLSVTTVPAAPQSASFAGEWNMAMTGGRQGGGEGGGGGQGGGPGAGAERRGGAQSLTITQDGDKFKVDHKTSRGDNTYDAAVSGNTISWSEERQNREGNAMKIEYRATLNGDTLTGTISGGQFNREFTAKRESSN
jgi:hypothetical protein